MKNTMKIKQIYKFHNFHKKLCVKHTRVSSKEIARMNAQATQSMVSILTTCGVIYGSTSSGTCSVFVSSTVSSPDEGATWDRLVVSD